MRGMKGRDERKNVKKNFFAFEEIKKNIFSLPPLHSEEPNSKARNVNYRSFQGSSGSVGGLSAKRWFFFLEG
jgi:hypothetical protein